MGIRSFLSRFGRPAPSADREAIPGEQRPSSQTGSTVQVDNWSRRLYAQMQLIDFELRSTILRIRYMDRVDGRIKKIHDRSARSASKGGLRLSTSSGNTRLIKHWRAFLRRTQLDRREKLESDLRGFLMEGSLPLQWVISTEQPQVIAAVRMPTETIAPLVDETGRFKSPRRAWLQVDPMSGKEIASFALYQLSVGRLNPDNYDDWGCLGRPYLDASRSVWDKLRMTEEDLVIRRRTRAPQRMHHSLPGADEERLTAYRDTVEQDQTEGNWRDYYTNQKDAAVTAVGGDAALDQIADVGHLIDTFFSGGPAPKGLFGYVDSMPRDILEDLKRDWYDWLDSVQALAAQIYEFGFRVDLMLRGIDPEAYTFAVEFAERHTETLNQRADRALKYRALGVPHEMVWEAAGLDPAAVRQQREDEARDYDPYPDDDPGQPAVPAPRVSITPGNERKGDSGTAITNS